jgi:L-aminopeptidase/D-esterase-like protein
MRLRTRACIALPAAFVSLVSTTADLKVRTTTGQADLKVRTTTGQGDLKVRTTTGVVQAFRPADAANPTLTAVPGIKVGHHTLTERPTGCTVVLIEAGATAGVDVRGAAPATRDTDLLGPTKMVQQIHGIALSGGSLFGLSSTDGVLRYLEEKNIGIVYGARHIPIVPAASVFDLGVGDGKVRPAADCGYRAATAARSSPVVEGSVGAGAGATLGKLQGLERAMKSGVGSAAIQMPDGLIVAALVVVNPLGDVIDPATGPGSSCDPVRRRRTAATTRPSASSRQMRG